MLRHALCFPELVQLSCLLLVSSWFFLIIAACLSACFMRAIPNTQPIKELHIANMISFLTIHQGWPKLWSVEAASKQKAAISCIKMIKKRP